MKLAYRSINSLEPFEYLPTTPGTAYELGVGLILTDELAAPATGETAPTHVSQGVATGAEDVTLPAIRVQPDMVFVAELSADGSALAIGDKVTIADDGINLTAVTTGGVAEITGFPNGTRAVGSPVLFRIPLGDIN